eukprot:9626-Heterococcus_DN1.PRE.1
MATVVSSSLVRLGESMPSRSAMPKATKANSPPCDSSSPAAYEGQVAGYEAKVDLKANSHKEEAQQHASKWGNVSLHLMIDVLKQ